MIDKWGRNNLTRGLGKFEDKNGRKWPLDGRKSRGILRRREDAHEARQEAANRQAAARQARSESDGEARSESQPDETGSESSEPPGLERDDDSDSDGDEDDAPDGDHDGTIPEGPRGPAPPLEEASVQNLVDQGYLFYMFYKQCGDSLAPSHSDSNVRYAADSQVPDDDGAYLFSDSDGTRHIPIRLAHRKADPQEDFTLLGGRSPSRLPSYRAPAPGMEHWSESEDTRPKHHYLGKTCVVVVSNQGPPPRRGT